MKKVLCLAVASSLLLGSGLSVNAAGLKNVFNAEYYAEKYPDLKAAFGNNEEALYQHFLTYGIKEGRIMNPIIDVVKYREKYNDLQTAFGDDWDSYVEHYFAYGVNEKRDNGTDFDLLAYLDAYKDLQATFGNDYKAIAEHYSKFGVKENRVEGSKAVIAAREAEKERAEDIQDKNEGSIGGGNTEDKEDTEDKETVVSNIVAYVDGNINYAKENSGKEAFVEQLNAAVSKKMGYDVTIELNAFEHSTYVDEVAKLIAAGNYPDVMIMSADMMDEYSDAGLLWDMSEAYDNAEFQSRMNLNYFNEALKTEEGALYGFTPSHGNGCVTYVKKSWLDAVGMKAEDIKTYDDFYAMLTAFSTKDPDGNGVDGDTYGYIIPGLYGSEAPHTIYLPEFWQDSYPAILQNSNGVWYDGFQTEETKAALLRLQKAYADGVIDPESITASTMVAREKYWAVDQKGSAGCFSYWAGSWYEVIYNNLQKNGIETDLVMLSPIEELEGYFCRETAVWGIVDDGDGDDSREQAIFEAFIETMLDGDTVQTLWTHGAEGIHWSTKAESFVTNAGTATEKKYEYAEGEFHFRPTIANPNTLYRKNYIDNMLVVSPLTNGKGTSNSELINTSNKFFAQNCVRSPKAPVSETYNNELDKINDAKMEVINAVVVNGSDVDAAMQTYIDSVGATIQICLDELNN